MPCAVLAQLLRELTFIVSTLQLKQVPRDRVAGPWANRKVARPGPLLPVTVTVSIVTEP